MTGTYDPIAGTFTPSEISSAKEHDWSAVVVPDEPDFSTPCPEPEGGWQVIDESRTTPETMDAVIHAAAALDGYAIAWVDQSPNPAHDPAVRVTMDPEDIEFAMNDPLLTIVNVKVTKDAAGAEETLRAIWGGMLCVSTAARTEDEILAILDEVVASTPGFLHGGPVGVSGTITLTVIHDDGTLQEHFDKKYGPGLIRVQSALVPADG